MSEVNPATVANPGPGPSPRRVDWGAVATFYGVACAISWPFFWWRDLRPESWAAWDAPGFLKGWAAALGPFLGSVVASIVYRKAHVRTVTFWGTSLVRGLLFAGVTIVSLTAVGVGDDEPHLTGLLIGLIYLVYALGEESGWRGFLEDALRPLPPLPRYVLIGVLWGTWHFTTFTRGQPAEVAGRMAMMAALWILGSWGMGRAMEVTRSILVAAMLHLSFNFATALPREKALIVLGLSAATWMVLLKTWKPSGTGPSGPPPPSS